MFNSCTFNSLNYNSLCVKQAVTPIKPPTGGTAQIKERKLRRLKIEFFNIIGTKLFVHSELIDIIGTKLILNEEFSKIISSILLSEKLKISLKGQKLNRITKDLVFLEGQVQYPIKIRQRIVGAKKFKNCIYRIIKGKRLILCKQLELIYGKKLVTSIENKTLKGSKKVPCKQNNLIRGQKDITEILKVLDILDIEE